MSKQKITLRGVEGRFINDDKKIESSRSAPQIDEMDLFVKILESGDDCLESSKHSTNCDVLSCIHDLIFADRTHAKRKMIPIRKDARIQKVDDISAGVINCPHKSIAGFHTLDNGLTFYGFRIDGFDGFFFECFAIVYWDGESIRLYVPTWGNYVYGQNAGPFYGEPHDIYKAKKRYGLIEDADHWDANVYNCLAIIEDIKIAINVL